MPALLLATLTACANQTTGTPTATSDAPDPTTESAATSSSTANPVDSIKPCSLLSASDVAALGITGAPKPSAIKGATSCDWRVEKQPAGDSFTIAIDVFPERGLKDMSGSAHTSTKVGKHDAIQDIDRGGCALAMGITDTSRVQVYIVGGKPADLCAVALETAKIIEPKLP